MPHAMVPTGALYFTELSGTSPVADVSNLCGVLQAASEDNNGKVKVYLRVRPLKPSELEKQEDQVRAWGQAGAACGKYKNPFPPPTGNRVVVLHVEIP